MKNSKHIIIITIITIILIVLIILLVRFVMNIQEERQKAMENAKKYVITNYGLKVLNVQVYFSIDGLCHADVSTEELPFKITVFIDRKDLNAYNDLYLNSLVEYKLEQLIREKLQYLMDGLDIMVVSESRFTRNDQPFTIEDINNNPNIIFDHPEITYFCSIDGMKSNDERIFSIFKQITEHFNPTGIYFHYVDIDDKNNGNMVYISEADFKNINDVSDLLPVAK